MASNHTTNYNLNQWEATDKVLRTDFNADNAKIDAALAGLAGTAAEHTTAIAGLGNCAVEHQSYTGTGAGTKTLTFAHPPMLVVIMTNNVLFVAVRGAPALARNAGVGGTVVGVGWSGNSISWQVQDNNDLTCGETGTTYQVTALLEV